MSLTVPPSFSSSAGKPTHPKPTHPKPTGNDPTDPPTLPPVSDKPWSPLQHAASDLGTTPDGKLHVDGFRWGIQKGADGKETDNGEFGDAYINPAKLTGVDLVIKPFSDQPNPFPGHAYLNFEFAKDAPVTDNKGHSEAGMALSVEVHFHEGEHYDPNSDVPHPVLYQLSSSSDAVDKSIDHDHELIQSYKLALTHDQGVALLKERVAKSCEDHSLDVYNLVGNSCVSTLEDGLNKVTSPAQQIAHTLPNGDPDPTAAVPIYCPPLFLTKGLFADPAPTTTFAKP
jgi:hypothetical protein